MGATAPEALICVLVGLTTLYVLHHWRHRSHHTTAAPPKLAQPAPTETPLPSLPKKVPLPEPTPDLERVSECVVCLEPIVRSAVGSCSHHFCAHCLLECCRYNPACPKCQTPIREVWLDPEFDALLRLARLHEPDSDTLIASRRAASEAALECHIVQLYLPRGTCAGITLCNAASRPGVAVTHLVERDMAFQCGLRVDDVIVSMNGTPCRQHTECIELIDRLSERSASDELITCLIVPGAAAVALPVKADFAENALDGLEHDAEEEEEELTYLASCTIL
jgi:hypothetical protein